MSIVESSPLSSLPLMMMSVLEEIQLSSDHVDNAKG